MSVLSVLQMNEPRFIRLVTALVLLSSAGAAHSETPDEFRARQRREMEEFRNAQKTQVETFRDSINREYARFIEQQWEQMQTLRNNRSLTPLPLAFAPRPSDSIPAPKPAVIPEPQFPPAITEPRQIPNEPTGREASFYGKTLTLHEKSLQLTHLRSTSGRDVADYWRALSCNMNGIIDELRRIENELGLDDWGVYRLAYELAPYYINSITPDEQVVFSVFVLSQHGFKCKMAESNSKLYPLLATANELFNMPYIEFQHESMLYYVYTTDRLGRVNVCTAEFPSASQKLDLTPPRNLPPIGGKRSSMQRTWSDYTGAEYNCNINYDPEIVRYLDSYPCIDFKKYVEGPIDDIGMNYLFEQLNAQMENMDTAAKLNHLLHFVQFAFRYKTDDDNYGYEKWNFPDATLAADFCDCDDRAILWCRLVKELVGVETALVHYPGVHLAAAASIEATSGYATVTSANREYVLCDPTYMGANIGMEMPSLAGRPRTVIPLF